ncbi:hypothetical protein [Micromonospora sp. HM5-17]|uniref:hypothetical protein n=1 Tax=Micromonospora sp. HM5-17 TaxID=2487710 RepID=UPI000F497766|nr:hypothetical protein [Micromonospora sp. HM5-17]ROT32859.1 hypothetical protein EF879_06670 [Micromonospora sp. HM5-17]
MIELWNWRIEGRVAATEIRPALADALGVPVLPLGAIDPADLSQGAVLADVWHRPGDFPTAVDCYAVPTGAVEVVAVAAFARRLRRACLLPDDTLDAGRHLLVTPDGTIRPVHLDVRETDDGVILSNQRLCTVLSPRCRGWAPCHQSRWVPDSVLPALAAA